MTNVICGKFECEYCGTDYICKAKEIELTYCIDEHKPFLKCETANMHFYYDYVENDAICSFKEKKENGKMD